MNQTATGTAAATTTTSVKDSHNVTFNILAKKVLESSGILPSLQNVIQTSKIFWNETLDSHSSPSAASASAWEKEVDEDEQIIHHVDYVKVLERVLDMDISSSSSSSALIVKNGCNSDDTSKDITSTHTNGLLLTCTDYNSSSFSKDPNEKAHSSNNDNNLPQYWTPTMETSDLNSSIPVSQYNDINHYDNDDNENDDDDDDIPLLEEFAPFSPKFYIHVGHMIAFIYNQYSSDDKLNQALHLPNDDDDGENDFNNKNDNQVRNGSSILGQYSLNHHVDTVRVTRIFSALMELNVGDHGLDVRIRLRVVQNNHTKDEMKVEEDDDDIEKEHISFLDLLLYYTEHNSLVISTSTCTTGNYHVNDNPNNNKNNSNDHVETTDDEMDTTGSKDENITSTQQEKQRRRRRMKQTKIPIIQSVLKYFAALPKLESLVHIITRRFRSRISSISSTEGKVEHMKMSQMLQEGLEDELENHITSLEFIFGIIYERSDVALRTKARKKMGYLLYNFVLTCGSGGGGGTSSSGGLLLGMENTSAAGIDNILKVMLRILKGISLRTASDEILLRDSHRHLLVNVLLPLHKPSGMVLWRDQKPILDLYHKTLVQCIATIVSLDMSLIGKVIQHLLHPDVWPLEGSHKNGKGQGSKMANTPKVILLLHEVDTYIGLIHVENLETCKQQSEDTILSDTMLPLALRLASCISSDNSRTSERALEFFKNKKFQLLVKLHASKVMTPFLKALCRINTGMDVPWNPTVRKMTLLVIKDLESYDKDGFEKSCIDIFSKGGRNRTIAIKEHEKSTGSVQIQSHTEAPSADMFSFRKSMGSWQPPSKQSGSGHHRKPIPTNRGSMQPPMSQKGSPPVTITGVAPWAVKHQSNTGSQPPVTITGVAPWAVNRSTPHAKTSTVSKLSQPKQVKHLKENNISASETVGDVSTKGNIAVQQIREYIDKLKPSRSENDDDDEDSDGISSWAKSQMSESPVLLPSLKFHDLVFGQVLGTGSFSTVKYARQIVKGKTRSHWPEFAVKIVSTEKITELGYEKSINREIAILQILSHPGISRLISSFRFRDGAYLVLEYANAGDLHTLLKVNGSLDEDSTKFVVGELVAALHSIHELDFVYVDLKPENVLVTESGHVKLTDFGGCRAISERSKKLLKRKGRDLVKNLRDGDWRSSTHPDDSLNAGPDDKDNSATDADDDDDLRIEGTTAYLPPEIISGMYPTFSTDSWALGCVFFQCIAGRPPILEDTDESTRQRIVSFDLSGSDSSSTEDDFFLSTENNGKTFSDGAKDLIKQLLVRDPNNRPNMLAVSEHAFFDGTDVFKLYKETAYNLDAGRVAPRQDSKWTRRQFSSIWAPQPQAYVITPESQSSCNGRDMFAPISEGDEFDAFFLSLRPGNKRPMLVGIKERD